MIKEEVPKNLALVGELDEAREREVQLTEEMELLLMNQQEEQIQWQGKFSQLHQEQNRTREELELISTGKSWNWLVPMYVNQLEDRLANYAIARKELQVKEIECAHLREEAARHAQEVDGLHCQVTEFVAKERDQTKPLLEELVKERAASRETVQALTNQVRGLNDQMEDWKARLANAERRNDEIKSQSARQLFLKVEEEKAAWELSSSKRMDDERLSWESKNELELQQVLTREKTAWESHMIQQWELRVANEKSSWEQAANADYQEKLHHQKSEVELALQQEWTSKLEHQRMELQHQFEMEAKRRMDEERDSWEALKEEELHSRLMEERSVWELESSSLAMAAAAAAAADDSASLKTTKNLEDEVERAAAKVYARLEQNDVSFSSVTMDPSSLDGVKKHLLLGNNEENGDDVKEEDGRRSEMEDVVMSDDDASSDNDEYENDVESEGANEEATIKLDSAASSSKEEDLTDNHASPKKEEVSYTSQPFKNTRQHPQQPPPAQQTPRSGVPLRAMRKAFSHVTGLHGLITPSTVQLRQHQQQREELRKRHQHQRRKTVNVKNKKRGDYGVDDDASTGETTTLLQEDDTESQSYDDHHELASSSADSLPSTNTMATMNDSWGSRHQFFDDSEEFVASSSSSSWSGNNALEHPPSLPEMNDRW